MAAAGIRAASWAGAAALAAGFLIVLAFHGERPEPGLHRFEPTGLLLDWRIEDVTALELSAGAEHRSFRRVAGGWRRDPPVGRGPDLDERIATGLTLLRNSAPVRILAAGEINEGALAEFGLAPPRLTLAVRAAEGRTVTIRFGGANPLALARYTRIDGRPEVILLPAFVPQAWERVMEAQ